LSVFTVGLGFAMAAFGKLGFSSFCLFCGLAYIGLFGGWMDTSAMAICGQPWPLGSFFQMDEDWPADVDRKCVEDAIDVDFTSNLQRARSVVIVRNGKMMFERYSDVVNEASPLLGWSMTKTMTMALVGILVKEGRLDINARLGDGLVPEFGGIINPKRDITLNHLLQMRTGILWTESWHLVNCLYNSGGDCAAYYAALPMVAEPGSTWTYR
jgi:CubicO group peptidase (beta-lactamase class C family)